jgi:transposase InsO family protein
MGWRLPTCRFLGPHIFDRVRLEHGIEHRLTKPFHPRTNGQAKRMNRTVKDATVKTFHYEDIDSLKTHVLSFVTAFNFAKHPKAPKWKTSQRFPWMPSGSSTKLYFRRCSVSGGRPGAPGSRKPTK